MKKETIYNQWKKHRRQVSAPDDFTKRVMTGIYARQRTTALDAPAQLPVFNHRPMHWAAAAGLVLIGLFRIFFVAVNLLRTSSLMPY